MATMLGRGGGALALADKLGWFGTVDRLAQAATVPELGELVDVSVFALQDMLTILGLYKGPKDGNWNDDVMAALRRWNQPDPNGAARFTLTVVPKADPQTVGFRRQVFEALQVDARAAAARPARPWWFWPAILTGSALGIYLIASWATKRS